MWLGKASQQATCHQSVSTSHNLNLLAHVLLDLQKYHHKATILDHTVTPKTIPMPNPKLGREAPCNHLWKFRLALVETNKVQTLGYNFVSGVM